MLYRGLVMTTSLRTRLLAALALVACSIGPPSWAVLEEADAPSAENQAAPAAPSQVWPRRFEVDDDTFTVYPLQLERWQNVRLDARAAVEVPPGDAERSLFGVVSVSAQTDLDEASGMVTVHDFEARSGSFPTAQQHATEYLDAVRRHLATVTWEVSRERLNENLAIDRAAARNRSQPLRNDPPRIVYVATPTVLVPIDGAPVLREMDGLGLQRVLNTRALLLQDPSAKRYFLYVAGYWLEATALDGPWTEAHVLPMKLDDAKRQAQEAGAVDLLEDDEQASARAPAVLVSTGATELVQTDGPPQYTPIGRTDLLFVSNSPNRLFLDLRTQMHYVLLAGRWYRTPSLASGPWTFVPGSNLPADFALIPDGHPTGGVRAAVPGTPQAQEATIANDVPELATVTRSAARLEITYDGAPQFRPIEGTSLEAAVNAPVPVIRVDWHSYYALDNGVWFFSDSAEGPWTAATSVPAVVYTIPRNDPLHYVTYVRVYDATNEQVYVGYTPGYVGSYASVGGTVVYGSGWYYRPWIGTVWYAPPVTWGFGFSFWYSWWDPWPWPYYAWPVWRPVPCFRPAWGPWPHHHVGVRHFNPVGVVPAKTWSGHPHTRHFVAGSGERDRHAFRGHRSGMHDIYRRWDPQHTARSGPRFGSPVRGDATRERSPSFHDRADQRHGQRADAPRWVRPGDRTNFQDGSSGQRAMRPGERSNFQDGSSSQRWMRPGDRAAGQDRSWVRRPGDRMTPPDRAAAPRSPGLRVEPRTPLGASPPAATPRSPGLRVDDPAAQSRQRQFDHRERIGDSRRTQPDIQRRLFRQEGAAPPQQDSSPNIPPRMRQPSWSDTGRQFRGAPQREDFRRERWRSPAANAPGSGIAPPQARERQWRSDRAGPSPSASPPGNRMPGNGMRGNGIREAPRARGDGFMRDPGSGSRGGSAFGPRQGGPVMR